MQKLNNRSAVLSSTLGLAPTELPRTSDSKTVSTEWCWWITLTELFFCRLSHPMRIVDFLKFRNDPTHRVVKHAILGKLSRFHLFFHFFHPPNIAIPQEIVFQCFWVTCKFPFSVDSFLPTFQLSDQEHLTFCLQAQSCFFSSPFLCDSHREKANTLFVTALSPSFPERILLELPQTVVGDPSKIPLTPPM